MTPNLSIERTCPGEPGHAAHLKRYASRRNGERTVRKAA